eukprot:TRINITY_DN9727_c0_g2_i1.p1 TRINITY_DN9727_c0_g2~~TRINITY_DN9727_c0_g2_i1.p1  ORF type:complete len:705 (-),score=178.96 TRINITY_DN9727_c0_g2_i1:72-2186(-)
MSDSPHGYAQSEEVLNEKAAVLQRAFRGYKKRNSVDGGKRNSGSGSPTSSTASAAAGADEKGDEFDKSSWYAIWNTLDMSEEKAFIQSHDTYEKLKSIYDRPPEGIEHEIAAVLERSATSTPADIIGDPFYSGPIIKDPLTLEQIIAMMEHFRKLDDIVAKSEEIRSIPMLRMLSRQNSVVLHKVTLHKGFVLHILGKAKEIFKALPNVVRIPMPVNNSPDEFPEASLTIVGDLHGQLRDLLQIFELKGLPSKTNQFLFNGDFVDRGTYSAEIVIVLFAFKILYPDFVHLNRGNHEAADINSRDGFEKECILKWDAEVFRAFSEVFSCLPLAYLVQEKLFVVHGGLAWTDFLISDIEEADRFHEVLPRDSLIEDILWSDPSNRPGRFPSDRGAGCFFGRDVTEEFMKSNNIEVIVRSHECVDEGWQSFFSNKLYTVFSASNYCGVTENKGAILVFQGSTFPKAKAIQYYSKSKELMRPINLPNVPIVVQDVMCKLGDVLMKNHQELRNFWAKLQEAAGKTDTIISKIQWTAGLVEVVKVQVPWLTVSKYLPGVKESISADGKTIDYDKFLLSYSPYQLFKKRMLGARNDGAPKAPKSDDPRVEDAMDKIYTAIYKNRYQLESLFRWFDEDGSGSLTLEEFIHGIRCLESLGLFPLGADGKGMPDEIIGLVVDKIDSNHDGEIAYDEFFEAFHDAVNKDILAAAF